MQKRRPYPIPPTLTGLVRSKAFKNAAALILLTTFLFPGCKRVDNSGADSIVTSFIGPGLGGVAVGVIRDHHVVFRKGFGPANTEAGTLITPETVFDLASVSKQFTGMGVLLLVQQHKLSLEDDVRKYVPELPVFDPDRPIRINDLSRHVSGLPEFPRGASIPTETDILSWLSKQRTLKFQTGSRWEYCNLNYFILARVVERISGNSLRAFLEEQVFAPAGMLQAQVLDRPDSVIRNRASGYCFGKPCRSDDGLTGPGGVFASLDDMVAWDLAIAQGKLVPFDSLQKQLGSGYALGWGVATHNGHNMIWHDGDSIGTSTYIAHYLDTPLTIIVLSNQTRLEVEKIERQVAEYYLR